MDTFFVNDSNMSLLFLTMMLITSSHITTGAQNEITSDNRFVVNAVIRHLFELFRNVVKNGDHEKGVPIMDPYKFNHAFFNASGKISAAANFTNVVMTGLGDFELGSLIFTKSELSMEFHLTFPLVSLTSEYYSMEGILFEVLPISAAGVAQVDIHNIVITGKLYLKQSDDGKNILLSHFKNMKFTMDVVESNTQFDNKIDGIINAMVKDLLADYLTRFSRIICAIYGTFIAQAANSILEKYETWHIIAVIL